MSCQVYNPANGEVLGSVPNCNTDDLNLAVDAAKNASESWGAHTAEVLFDQKEPGQLSCRLFVF
jgi:acyl-CoA reductase-like NAD-dependent aldehyde dehydrogenase